MSFSTPSNLSELVLYWWKILDRATIVLDDLHQFIAFELFTFPLEKSKAIISQAIDKGLLDFDPETEKCALSVNLAKQLEEWQKKGTDKVKKAASLLNEKPYPAYQISEEAILDVYFHDLMDAKVLETAKKIRSSWVKIDTMDLQTHISGKVKQLGSEAEELWYEYSINPQTYTIVHNCPEYLNLRKDQKMFCPHLGRVLIKIAAQQENREEFIELLKNLVRNKGQWKYQ